MLNEEEEENYNACESGVSIGFSKNVCLKTRLDGSRTHVFLEVGGILDAYDIEFTLTIRASHPTNPNIATPQVRLGNAAIRAVLPEIHMTKQLVACLQGSAHPNIKRLDEVAQEVVIALVRWWSDE